MLVCSRVSDLTINPVPKMGCRHYSSYSTSHSPRWPRGLTVSYRNYYCRPRGWNYSGSIISEWEWLRKNKRSLILRGPRLRDPPQLTNSVGRLTGQSLRNPRVPCAWVRPAVSQSREKQPNALGRVSRKAKITELFWVWRNFIDSLNVLISFYAFYPESMTREPSTWEIYESPVNCIILGCCVPGVTPTIFMLFFICKTNMDNGISSFYL